MSTASRSAGGATRLRCRSRRAERPEPERGLLRRSDQWPFRQAGIPATNFVFGHRPVSESERIHRQWYREGYHTPKDDLHQRIDWKPAEDFNRFYYALVGRVTGNDAAPTRNHSLRSSTRTPRSTTPRAARHCRMRWSCSSGWS